MPVKKLKKHTNNNKHDNIDIVKCGRYIIQPSAIESVSDVIVPFQVGAKVRVIVNTIGGKSHEELFSTEADAEVFRQSVLETVFK
jgi:hypothetical protein